jgi:hypothetical protein
MPLKSGLSTNKIKKGPVYLKGRSEERYLAHYEPERIPAEYEVMLYSIV